MAWKLFRNHILVTMTYLKRSFISFTLLVALALSTFACAKRPRETTHPLDSGLDTFSDRPVGRAHSPRSSTLTPKSVNRSRNQRINLPCICERDGEAAGLVGLATRIVGTAKNTSVRRPEHLIMVRGFGDRRFRALRDMIMVE